MYLLLQIVDRVYNSLVDNGMLDNTIIVFASDNGGQAIGGGASNWPLRGMKVSHTFYLRQGRYSSCPFNHFLLSLLIKVSYAVWAVDFKSEVEYDLRGCLEYVVASKAVKKGPKPYKPYANGNVGN